MEKFNPEEEAMFIEWEKSLRGPWYRRLGRWIMGELEAEGERIREFGLSPDDIERHRPEEVLGDHDLDDGSAR